MEIKAFTYKRKGFWTKDIGAPADVYYLGEYTMEQHIRAMLADGWEVMGTGVVPSRMALQAAVAVLTCGISLLGRGPQPSITVTFMRTAAATSFKKTG